jgi:hypothetical protein
MKIKKLIFLSIVLIGLVAIISGCTEVTDTNEYYNQNDQLDFSDGYTLKYKICELQQILDIKTIKESNLSGGFFLFVGGISGSSKEETNKYYNYYVWLESTRGAMMFFVIPYDKVRIYQDAPEGEAWAVGFEDSMGYTRQTRYQNRVDLYDMFNFHLPKGTIITRKLDNIDIEKWLKK